jgi:hypothetical protein
VRRIELSVAVLITCSPAIARAADRLGPDLDARNPALVAERFTTTIHERVTAAGLARRDLDRALAVAAGSPGGLPIMPSYELAHPVGIGDVAALTGKASTSPRCAACTSSSTWATRTPTTRSCSATA